METFAPTYLIHFRACCVAFACCLTTLQGGENQSPVGPKREKSRSNVGLEEARELLSKGDAAYENARYADAVEAYAGARDLIADELGNTTLRAAATQRHAQASVEYARALSRKGDVSGALAVVEKALSISPQDSDALAFRNELNDPLRTNPALTKEHAKNVDSVRRLLYTAEGAFGLGKYDQAKQEYEKVLRIDPTNTAARRGMEQVATAKSTYLKSAYDHTRAEMLGQVDAAWELQVPPLELDPGVLQSSSGALGMDTIPASNKIDRIIIPQIALDQTTLSEAIDFLRVRAAENDTLETDPSRRGVNFTINLGPPDSEAAKRIQELRFDLRLSQVPLSQALRYIAELTQTAFTTDDFSVIISPLGSTSDALVSRSYRVPPDFISSLTSGATVTASTDPFAADPATSGVLATRMGAREALEKQGIAFPEGSSVAYLPGNNMLRVVNTPANQDFIAQVIQSIAQAEPMMISVRVTMIETEQINLQELGFDWLLTPFGIGDGEVGVSGGTTGNGNAVTDVPDSVATADPLTAGLRSGDAAITGDSIDAVIGAQRGRQTSARAPGIMGLRGNIDEATISTLMRGLDLEKSTDVLSKPAVTTRSGQSSSVAFVREFIYPTEYEPPELPTNTAGDTSVIIIDENGNVIDGSRDSAAVTPATPTAFEKRDTGVTLEVLPVADGNKQYIDVTLSPQFVNFDGFVNYGSPINQVRNGLQGSVTVPITENAILMPIFSKNSVTSSLKIVDGGTIVVGGLLRNSIQDVEDKVPVLGSIPLLGRFFQTKARQPISKAIIFLVNVEIIDPTGRPYRNR